MQFKYAIEQLDYSDFASGKVLYSMPRHPAFPVRLASEIFQRCVAHRKTNYNNSTPCTLYDPCCGAAYHLSVLGYLHRELIKEVIGSDIDEKIISLANQNLGLLNITGLEKRIGEISKFVDLYNKESHKDALASANNLKIKLSSYPHESKVLSKVFQADATDSKTILQNVKIKSVDIVFTDIPYGQHSHWQNLNSDELYDPIWLMLNALIEILSPSSIVAIVSDKKQKVAHKNYQRVEQFQIGKRRVVILKPN